MQEPTFYLYIQRRLIDYTGDKEFLMMKDVAAGIKQFRIPKILVPAIIKELEKLGLVERIQRDKIKVINPNRCNIILQPSKLNDRVGIF